MEGVLTRLPRYARGLRLVRIGVFAMLAQLVLAIVMTVKALGGGDASEAFTWMQYFLWANIGASVAMLIGSALAIPDFQRARLPIRLVVLAVACFSIATAALWWTHHVLSAFMQVALDPDPTVEAVASAVEGLDSLMIAVVVKDLAYVLGLIAVLRTVRQSAVANDQLALRDVASHLTGMFVVMLLGDLFYQVTYGLGPEGGVGFTGLVGSLLIGGYWIYCHFRLLRFLENAAYLVNEPHRVPAATIIGASTAGSTPRPSARAIPAASRAPSTPSAPVIVLAPEIRPAPVPRAASEPAEDESADRPRFLT